MDNVLIKNTPPLRQTPSYALVLVSYFNFRWNVRSSIRSRRANCDIFPGLMAAVTRDAAASKGIDVDSIGLNLPRAGAMSAEGDDSFSSTTEKILRYK